jgi:hypothetical protein
MENNTDYSKFFKNLSASVEQETEYGVYVWEMPTGQYLGDGGGRFLSIDSRQNDIKRMTQLANEVKSFGVTEGSIHFLADRYKVTDGEWESMMERLDNEQMPDPADPGNLEGLKDE